MAEQTVMPWAEPEPSAAPAWEAIQHYRAQDGRTAGVDWIGGRFFWHACGVGMREAGGEAPTFAAAIEAAERAAGWRR